MKYIVTLAVPVHATSEKEASLEAERLYEVSEDAILEIREDDSGQDDSDEIE